MADVQAPQQERAVVTYDTDYGQIKLSPGIIRKYLVSGGGNVSDQEVMMFLSLCKYQKLNPFVREAYLVKYGDQPATVVAGKESFTRRAEKHPQHDGMEAGVIVTREGGEPRERTGTLVLPGEEIVGGWAKAFRKDRGHPTYVTVSFGEYVGRKKDGTPNRQWSEKPATMIRKVALVQALREAYPTDFAGLYDSAEMSNVDAGMLPERAVTVEENGNGVEALKAELRGVIDRGLFTDAERAKFLDVIGKLTTVESLNALRPEIERTNKAQPVQAVQAEDVQKEIF